MRRLLPAALVLLLAASAGAQDLYEQAGASAWDVAVVRGHLQRWAGPGRGCFDASADAAALAACAAEAEADDPLGSALIAYHVALHAIAAGDYAAAAAWADAAVAAPGGELAEDEPLWIVLISTLGSALILAERYDEARVRWAQTVDLGRRGLADAPADLAMSILHLAWTQLVTGRAEEGVQSCAEAAADPEAEHLRNAFGLLCLAHLGAAASSTGDWGTAASWWTAWLRVAGTGVLPPDDPQVRMMQGQVGRARLEQGDFEGALALLEPVDRAYRAAPPPDDPAGVAYSFWIARARLGQGRLAEAEALFGAYIAAVEAGRGPAGVDLVYLLDVHGDVLQRLGRYGDAEARYRRAVALGEPRDQQADALNRLADLLLESGRAREALPVFAAMEALQARLFGPASAEVATAVFGRAKAHKALGAIADAKVDYERALALYEAAYGPEHPFVASALTSLATLQHELGDFTRAVPLYERAVAIYEATPGFDERFLGTALNNLAQVRWATGDLQAAHDLFWRSFDVLGRALGPDHPQVTSVRANYAGLLVSVGQATDARDLLLDCVAASTRRLGADNPDLGKLLSRLADAQYYTAEWPESARNYERAIAITTKAWGPDHPDLVELHQELAQTWALLGKRGKARAEMAAALDLVDRVVRPLLDVTSERERLALIRSLRDNLDKHLSFLADASDVPGNYAAMLGWKGAVRTSLAEQRAARQAGDDPEAAALADTLDATRRELATLVFGGGEPPRDRIAALTAEKERLEQALSRRSRAFAARQAEARVTPQELCERLERDEVLVDYLRYDRTLLDAKGRPEETVTSYLAMVSLGGACGAPLRLELGDAASIDLAIARYRRRVASGAAASALEPRAKELRQRLWDPVAAASGGRERVWLVPDGALSALPFAALLLDDGRFLVESHRVATLANALDLLHAGPPGEGALVAGGVVYDAPGAAVGEGAAVATRAAPRGGLEDFGYLAATKAEAEAVATRLGPRGVTLLEGSEVSESRLRREAPGKRVLHLATHGFFATGAERSGLGEAGGMNPMLLSGVVLAGANVGGTGGDDGILTAEEVVGLDLRGVELVVLSACETGLGEVQDGEGVLGLRRAFALAGARALVLSLWKVPDDATRALMEGFYAALATEPPADALRTAQLGAIAALRAAGQEPHPASWAAFVASGR